MSIGHFPILEDYNEILRYKINYNETRARCTTFSRVTFAEIQFWRRRLENVESIYNQMRDPRVKKMASILELSRSSYAARFKNLLKDVIAG